MGRTVLRGCCTKICVNLIMSASLLSVFARSIIASAEFCWSHGPAAASSVVNAVTETGLHLSAPPAASCSYHVVRSALHTKGKLKADRRTQAFSQRAVESAMTCAMRLLC